MSEQVPSDTKLLDKAWKDFMAAWCALRALVEKGGATIKVDVKVKAAKRKKA